MFQAMILDVHWFYQESVGLSHTAINYCELGQMGLPGVIFTKAGGGTGKKRMKFSGFTANETETHEKGGGLFAEIVNQF